MGATIWPRIALKGKARVVIPGGGHQLKGKEKDSRENVGTAVAKAIRKDSARTLKERVKEELT